MRSSTAYFAGVATVFAATALGFGGAMILTSATAPRTPAEPTKLERSVATPAQAAPFSSEKNAATITEASAASHDSAPATPVQPQEAGPSPLPLPVHSASTAVQLPASTQSSTTAPTPPADLQAKQPADVYARASDEDVRKYVRKRERHWARRHYRNDGATTSEQVSNSAERNVAQSTSSSLGRSTESVAQPGQAKAVDQTPGGDDGGNARVKRKHERRWTRGNFRDDDPHAHGDDRRSLEMRETPSEEAPQPFLGMQRWRPVFDDDD